jgi:DMSO/TMAO reductase YedYZ molybdopterin-dependent catalytic subunit
MPKRRVMFLVVLALLDSILVGCGATPTPTKAPAPPVTLKITGDVEAESVWDEERLRALGTTDVDYTSNDGTTTTYTGVLIGTLLQEANVSTDAQSLVLLAGDGSTYELPMAGIAACADCIIAFDPEGGLRSVLPGQSGKAQVKGLVEIQVKGGGGAPRPASGIPIGAALAVTGNVETEIGWTEDQVEAMPTKYVQSTNKSGETQTYAGVGINDLLALAKPKSDATGLVFVASDGFTAEVALAEVRTCDDCIVSFRSQGGFSTMLPGFPGNAQVKGVIVIHVK